jgi:hypothetical protein
MRTAALLLVSASMACAAPPPPVQDGDLIFHTSRSSQSLAVRRATGSRFSHMGIILTHDGHPQVFEAVATVSYTPLEQWIARGVGRRFVVKRLRNARQVITADAVARLRQAAAPYEGKRYDLTFEWSDGRIYCSELAYKMYRDALDIRIGELQKVRDLHLDDPEVKKKMRERYGDQVPLDAPVLSPQAMFESPLLETVFER